MFQFLGVLANDQRIDDGDWTALVAQDVSDGQLTLNGDGSFLYDPQGFAGTTTFTYRIDDGQSLSEPATVTLVVNTPPRSLADEFQTDEDTVLDVSADAGVLANDVDAMTALVKEADDAGHDFDD